MCNAYRAENAATARCGALAAVVPDALLGPIVDAVTHDALFLKLRRMAGNPDVAVTWDTCELRAAGVAYVPQQHISLSNRIVNRTHSVLLHELAHLCSPANQDHSPVFAANFLLLVQRWLGPEAAETLVVEFRKEGLL